MRRSADPLEHGGDFQEKTEGRPEEDELYERGMEVAPCSGDKFTTGPSTGAPLLVNEEELLRSRSR